MGNDLEEFGSAQSAVSSKELIDAALALEWMNVGLHEAEDEAPTVDRAVAFEAVFAASGVNDSTATTPATSGVTELNSSRPADNEASTDNHSWLADELLE